MKMSWQNQESRIECRWSAAVERLPYHPQWIQDTAASVPGREVQPLAPLFSRMSPFGGARWYTPARAR